MDEEMKERSNWGKDPERAFKGIWIPKEIWLMQELKIMEVIFLAEIDSLDDSDMGGVGCTASNAYFGKIFGITNTRVSIIINELIRKGFVEQVGFNGRRRFLKSLVSVQVGKRKHTIGRQPLRKQEGSLDNERQPITKVKGSINEKLKAGYNETSRQPITKVKGDRIVNNIDYNIGDTEEREEKKNVKKKEEKEKDGENILDKVNETLAGEMEKQKHLPQGINSHTKQNPNIQEPIEQRLSREITEEAWSREPGEKKIGETRGGPMEVKPHFKQPTDTHQGKVLIRNIKELLDFTLTQLHDDVREGILTKKKDCKNVEEYIELFPAIHKPLLRMRLEKDKRMRNKTLSKGEKKETILNNNNMQGTYNPNAFIGNQ